jgi:hypothetical protein
LTEAIVKSSVNFLPKKVLSGLLQPECLDKSLLTFPYHSGFEYTGMGYGVAFAIRKGEEVTPPNPL